MMNFKRIAFKISVLISTAYAVIMLLHWPIGFTFFTQLSNIYAAAVVLLQLISRKKYPLLKYSATVSIFITFAVYLLVLAPMMPGGIFAAYRQDHYASFCLHVLTPVFTIADFFLNDTEFRWEKKHLLYAVLPPVCYLMFILVLGKLGVRWGRGNMTAPYLFLNYGAPAGWFGFMPETASYTTLGIGVFYCIIVLLLLVLLIGWLFLALAKKTARRM
jgi:hypothetical protein